MGVGVGGTGQPAWRVPGGAGEPLVGEGTLSVVLELTLQALGVPSEEGLGAWERPAEKRALRNVGGRGVRMDSPSWDGLVEVRPQ